MSTQSNNNTRIAKNTFLLYFRMLFMMVVSLYTSRVILNTLGVEDFSISENNESLLLNCRAKNFRANKCRAKLVWAMPSAAENHMCVKCMKMLNKQVEILTTQHIGTCKSAYTKGLCPKLFTNSN